MVIASHGVEVLDGATARVVGNSVSGNECNLQPGVICGPDPIDNTEASGILSFGAATSTRFADNNMFANDMGIYTDDGITITGNRDSRNRAAGIYVDTDATKLHVTHNTTNADGFYGIVIGPCITAFWVHKRPKSGRKLLRREYGVQQHQEGPLPVRR